MKHLLSLKTQFVDNEMLEFSLVYPSWYYTELYKYGKRTVLVLYTLGVFLIKQFRLSRLLHTKLGATYVDGYLSSNIQCAFLE